MNNDNLGGPINPQEPSTPVTPVNPEVPVQPVQPVTPVTPVQPVEPVAQQVPFQPVQPMQQPVQPVQPVEPIQPMQPAKKNNNTFVIIVIVLILAIAGVGVYLLFGNKGNESNDSSTTTTESTTAISVGGTTTNRVVTTRANTTTIPTTTRSSESPVPVASNNTVLTVGKYKLTVPSDYKMVISNGRETIVNKKLTVQAALNQLGFSYNKAFEEADEIAAILQSKGYNVKDIKYGYIGTHQWLLFLTDYSSASNRDAILIYGITELDSNNAVEAAILTAEADEFDKIFKDINNMIDSKTANFAEGAKVDDTYSLDGFDALDERAFE